MANGTSDGSFHAIFSSLVLLLHPELKSNPQF
jgi:hypothetical protein